jgi:RHS repeat-associated protein
MTSMSLYDFGAATPTRVYNNTYLSDATGGHPAGSTYNAQHIHNRLLTSTVTQNSQTTTLVSNSYDSYDPGQCGATRTPTGWDWVNSVGSIDPTNTNNVFRGNVTTSNRLDMTHKLCYGTTGAVVMSIDGGHTTTTQTSSQTNYTAPNTITTGSLTTSLNWSSSLNLTNETGPNGDGIGIGYDLAGRPSRTTTPYGAYTTFTYSTSPAQTTAVVTTTDPNTNGRKTITSLDGFGRTIQVDSIDAGGSTRSRVKMQYAACGCSPLGKLAAQSRPYDPNANGGNPPIYWTTYTYDGLGRTLSVIAPDGVSTATYSYVANTATVTDPAGKWKKFTMDAFGNLTSVVEPDASQTNSGNQATTTYTYDALNHLIGVSMPRRMPGGNIVTQVRTFNYVVGSSITAYLRSATNPENGTVFYTYNVDGTLASKTDAKGQTLKYAYDTYGRVLTLSLAGSPDTVLRTYTYDSNSADPTYSQYASGRLTTVQYSVPSTSINQLGQQFTGDTVTEMYSYTQAGLAAGKRLHVARQQLNAGAMTADLNATWTYNNEGRLTGMTYPGDPNGFPVAPSYSYTYDGMGRLNTMTDGTGATMVSGTQYNAAGQMTVMGTESRIYNSMGQLTSVSAPGLNITYTYPIPGQNNGKITSQTDNLSGEQVTYLYDSLNRLTSAQGSGWNQGFVYDPFGNLTDKNGSNSWHGVPDATTNHLGSVDANGNALNSPAGAMLAYDAENRLSSANGTTLYAYDGQNKRIWTCTLDQAFGHCQSETYYFYSPQGKLMGQFMPSTYNGLTFMNGPTRAYFGGRLLGNEDRLGSRGKYFPYGEDRSAQNPGNDSVKFATYTRDSATGMDYADQRYYSSSLGRFLTPDPYKVNDGGPGDPIEPQSWNRYPYVQGDPINYFDQEGLVRNDIWWQTVQKWKEWVIRWLPSGPSKPEPPNLAEHDDEHPRACPPIPAHPSLGPNEADVVANVMDALLINLSLQTLVAGGLVSSSDATNMKLAYVLYEFAPGQPQDYKQYSPDLREFGNFNFGAVTSALGLSQTAIQWAAGLDSYAAIAFSQLAKYGFIKSPPPSFGTPLTGPPYGDSPREQDEIAQGYTWATRYLKGCQ